jgi:hypothetical protein
VNGVVTLRVRERPRGPETELSFGPLACAALRLRVTDWFTVHCLLFTLLLLTACDATLPPLRGKAEIGRDAYAVFVGGSGLSSDLYAVRGDGGPAVPLTYTPVAELAPALAPDGGMVAFLRGRSLRDSTPATVWVLNLLSGVDRELRLPQDAGTPHQVSWSRDGRSLVVRAERGLYQLDAPPARSEARRVGGSERAVAESSLAVLLGNPIFARVVPCQNPGELCVLGDTGAPGFLARGAQQAIRWGPDSVALLIGERVEIRPLGRGRARRLTWSNLPEKPREVTFFEGRRQRE